MDDFERTIVGMNGEASILRTSMAKVDLNSILDQRAYESTKAERTKLAEIDSIPTVPSSHLDPSVSTLTFDLGDARVDMGKFERFLQDLLWEKSFKGANSGGAACEADETTTVVLRAKGTIRTSDGDEKMLQAVQEVYELKEISRKGDESLRTRLVLIGKHLHRKSLERALNACLV